MLRWRSLGELSPFDITWSQEVSGGPPSLTQLSHLRGSALTPVSHTAQKKREKRKEGRKGGREGGREGGRKEGRKERKKEKKKVIKVKRIKK